MEEVIAKMTKDKKLYVLSILVLIKKSVMI